MNIRSTVHAYVVTITAVIAAVLLRWLLDPWAGELLALGTLYGAVAAAVWVGGVRTAILATFLGYFACDWLFIAPRGEVGLNTLRDLIGFLLYLISCGVITFFGESVRRSRQRIEDSLKRLEQEIAQRQQTEEALAKTADSLVRERERLAVALRTGQLGVYEWRLDEPIVWWSPELYPLYGVAAESFTPTVENFSALVHPEDRAELWQKTEECIAQRKVFAHEYRIIRPDGAVRWIANRSYINLDALAQVEQLTGVAMDVTERRQADQSLRESEARYRQLFEQTVDGIFVADAAGRYLDVNPAGCQMLGLTRAEVLNSQFTDILIPEEHERLATLIPTFADGAARVYEWRFRRKDGSVFIGEVAGLQLPDGHFQSIVRDISERRRMEEELRQSEERFRLATNAGAVGVWDWDIVANTVLWSDSLYQIHEVRPDEFSGTVEGFAELIHPDDRERVNEAIQRTLQENAPYELEFRALRPDGSTIWIATQAQLVRNGTGTPLRLLGSTVDITRRKEAELALRASEVRFRQVFEQAPVGMVQAALNGRIQQINPAGCTLLGRTAEELIGIHPDELTPAEYLAGDQEYFHAVFKGLSQPGREKEYWRGDGSRVWGQMTATLVRDSQGNPAYYIAIIEDITKRKQAEANLRASHNTFRQLVENSPFGIYAVDADFRLAQVGAGAQKVFANVRPLLGRDFAEVLRIVWPEPFATEAINIFRHTLATGETYHAPSTVEQRSDIDAVEAYDWKVERITLPDGRFGAVCHFYDLSERQRYEAALHASESQYRLIVEGNPALICRFRADGVLTFVNDTYCRAFSKSRDELVGQRFTPLVPAEDQPVIARLVENLAPTMMPYTTEHRVILPGGEIRWHQWTNKAVVDDEGQFYEYQAIGIDITERKQAEHKLRESEERFAKAFNASPLSLTLSSLKTGQLVEVNDTFVKITGYPRAEALGRTTVELGLWKDFQEREAEMNLVRQMGQVRDTDYIFKTKSGAEIVGRLSAEYIEIGGEPCALTLIQDVTDRKRTEEALRESEARFRNMADHAPVMIWVTEQDGSCTYLSQSWYKFTGQTPETGLGFGWVNATHPDDEAATHEAFVSANAQRIAFRLEYRLRRQDGTYAWVIDSAQPRWSEGGQFLGYIGSVIDITDRKRVEEDLRASEQQLRSALTLVEREQTRLQVVLSTLPVGVMVTDAAGSAVMLNQALNDIWRGQKPLKNLEHYEQYLAWDLETQQPFKSQDWPISKALLTATPQTNQEFGFRRFDGTTGVMNTVAVPIKDEKGQLIGGVAVAQDITTRKDAEAERECLLLQEQRARETAEAATRAKDEFVALVSHELRNPLNTILGYNRLLQKPETLHPTEHTKFTKIIDQSARRQLKLIEDLLDTARFISGKLRLDMNPCDLVWLVQMAVDEVRPTAEAKQIALLAELDETLEPLMGDPDRLQQIVWNLLSNALKFTPTGGSVIVRLTRSTTQEIAQAQLTITDTGQGIAPEALPYIFNRFRQADPSSSRRYGGLGLGLALVQQLTELHGGTVTAASAGLGQGATFTVCLPLPSATQLAEQTDIPTLAAAPETERQPEYQVELAVVTDARLSGLRVLLVDDEAEARELVRRLLQEQGALVTSVASGAAALSLLSNIKAEAPDAVISDIGMPEIDGYDFMRQVRALGWQMPAIALTAFGRAEDRLRALTAGFQMHVPKPVEPEELLTVLASLTGRLHKEKG